MTKVVKNMGFPSPIFFPHLSFLSNIINPFFPQLTLLFLSVFGSLFGLLQSEVGVGSGGGGDLAR